MKLFINTCFETVMIGIISDDNELIGYNSWKADRQESRKLTPKIAEMLSDAKLSKRDLSQVYVVTGPGSFTAVRIGFIVARAFADSLEVDLYVCNSFEFLSRLYKNEYDHLELKAGGGKVYKVDLKDSSYDISEPCGITNASELELDVKFKDEFTEVVDNMRLVKNIYELEPNYVKEPNITIAKG